VSAAAAAAEVLLDVASALKHLHGLRMVGRLGRPRACLLWRGRAAAAQGSRVVGAPLARLHSGDPDTPPPHPPHPPHPTPLPHPPPPQVHGAVRSDNVLLKWDPSRATGLMAKVRRRAAPRKTSAPRRCVPRPSPCPGAPGGLTRAPPTPCLPPPQLGDFSASSLLDEEGHALGLMARLGSGGAPGSPAGGGGVALARRWAGGAAARPAPADDVRAFGGCRGPASIAGGRVATCAAAIPACLLPAPRPRPGACLPPRLPSLPPPSLTPGPHHCPP
jgi:hypothetical protein